MIQHKGEYMGIVLYRIVLDLTRSGNNITLVYFNSYHSRWCSFHCSDVFPGSDVRHFFSSFQRLFSLSLQYYYVKENRTTSGVEIIIEMIEGLIVPIVEVWPDIHRV